MNIYFKSNIDNKFKPMDVDSDITLEEFASIIEKENSDEFEYRILLARVNGLDTELTKTLHERDRVELLDMRTRSADLTYQRGLAMIYLKAISDVMAEEGQSGVRGEIENSLNKGLFTRVVKQVEASGESDPTNAKTLVYEAMKISEMQVAKIHARMREIVEADLPFNCIEVTKEEAIKRWERYGYPEKVRLLESVDEELLPKFYELDNYENYFFGPMVPSTGYIEYFELRKYQDGILVRYPDPALPNEMPKYRDDFKLYEAFTNEYKWLELLDAKCLPDINKIIKDGNAGDMILLSEALHEKRIAEIADMIKSSGKRIILIAGPSSSGKTTFARRLCIQLRVNGLNPLYMGTDDYFAERDEVPLDEKGEKNYENLNAMDLDLFGSNIRDLLEGKLVDLPEFDFIGGHKVFGKRMTKIEHNQPIVIEGIHALNKLMTEQIDENEKFRIYISPFMQLNIDSQNRIPTTDARMLRRMVRDYKYRGHSASMTIKAWPKVRQGEEKNIFPYNGEADVVFNSTLPYEICLLKKYAMGLLSEISSEEAEYGEAQRLLEFFRFFNIIEEEKYVPNNSIVREFIGGSIFVD